MWSTSQDTGWNQKKWKSLYMRIAILRGLCALSGEECENRDGKFTAKRAQVVI